VEATVLPDIDKVVIGPPHGKLAAEQLALEYVAMLHVIRAGDRVPEVH
jgi:hypothetical protein